MDTTNDGKIPESGRKFERRQSRTQVSFPLMLAGGVCVPDDRRREPDRRRKFFVPGLLLFRDIHDERLLRLLADCPVRECAENEVLLAPGQLNHNIYLVLSGRLIVRISADPSAPPLVIQSGECVGELSIIDGKPPSAYVSAEAGCRVLVVSDTVFWSQIISVPGIARNLLTILSERMRQDNELILRNVQQRLYYEHIEKELRTAHSIQASMLPRGSPLFPGREDFHVHALMDTAKEIGGDFYDVFLIDDCKLFFAIGDVSGKGIPAALFMVKTVTLLRMQASRGAKPHKILSRVNRRLCENNDYGMFVTVLCGIVDLTNGMLTYCNGGHDAPLVGGSAKGFAFLDSSGGPMLGIAPDASYESARKVLQPGDTMLCYTDGVTEAMNPAQELFGHEALARSLAGLESVDPAHVVRVLHAEIRAFAQGAPQSDDIAVLALKYRGQPPGT